MTSDDTPLVIEGGNDLPARDNHRIIIIGYAIRVERPAGETYKYNPATICQSLNSAAVSNEVSWLLSPCSWLQRRTHKNPAILQRDHGN